MPASQWIRQRRLLGAAALSAFAFAIGSPGVSAQGFSLEGETVDSITASGAGGSGDAYMRYLQTYYSRHLPGQPTVLVHTMDGGGGIIGTNYFANNALPDGKTYFLFPPSGRLTYLMNPDNPDFEFNPHVWKSFLASPMGRLIYVAPESGITSVEDIRDFDGELTMGLQSVTGSEMPTLLSIEALGLKVRPVFGLDGGEKALAFQRGELLINTDVASAWLQRGPELVAAGDAIPLFSFGYENEAGEIVRDPLFPDVPSWPEAYEIVHGKKPEGPMMDAWLSLFRNVVMTSRTLVLPEGTSDEIYEVYVTASRDMLNDQEFKDTVDEFLGPYPQAVGEQAQRLFVGSLNLSDEARDYVKTWLSETHGAQF